MKTNVRLLLLALSASAILWITNSCKKNDDSAVPDTNNWKYGQTATYAVQPGVPVTDPISGLIFNIPSGGTTVKVTEVLSGPGTPFNSKRFKIEYSGDVPLEAEVHCKSGSVVMGMMYGYPEGLYNGVLMEDWIGLANDAVSLDSSIWYYTLPQLYDPLMLKAGGTKQRGSQYFSFPPYEKNFPEFDRKLIVDMKVDAIIDQGYIPVCNSPLKEQVIAARSANRLRTFFGNTNCYEPWWVKLGWFGGEYYSPSISFKYGSLDPTDGDIAHESAHHFINLVIGNEKQKILSRQGSIFDDHGISNIHTRAYVVDEFVYFCETMTTTGGLKRQQLSEPADALGFNLRSTTDYPSIEGFTGTMLYSLVRPGGSIKDVNNKSRILDIPEIGLTYGQVFDIIAVGGTDANQIRINIENYLGLNATPMQSERFRVALQRIGWSYSIKGKLVDGETGDPLENFKVTNILKGGEDREYSNGDDANAHITTSGGFFYFSGTMFPGSSTLRFEKDGQIYDTVIAIAYNAPTNTEIDMGTFRMPLGDIKVGSKYQGGIVAYLLQPGDEGYDPNVPHGIIVANPGPSANAPWGCTGTAIGGTEEGWGKGLSNTQLIVNGCADPTAAARICYDLAINGYDDWWLPSKAELNVIWQNRVAIGSIADGWYFSSTESNAHYVWGQNFPSGEQKQLFKDNLPAIIAIRGF